MTAKMLEAMEDENGGKPLPDANSRRPVAASDGRAFFLGT